MNSCTWLLWERVKDLRIGEFLRELVSVVASSDLAGSCIVKVLHCGESRDTE